MARPAEVPPETLLELARPVFHHRTSEFRAILAQVTDDLKYVFGTEADVFVFTASGTGAMESSVVNLLRYLFQEMLYTAIPYRPKLRY